jgi:NitT/TauT family transport system substrate-binding protein
MKGKPRKKSWAILLTMLGLAVLLVACGTGEPSSSDGKPGEQAAASGPVGAGGALKTLVVAEPLHSIGYLPLYVAIDQGFFEGIDVTITTLTGGGAHTNAVLTGEAWAFIGGPEHNAFAKAKGADLRSIVNVVNKGNVYLVARSGLEPGEDVVEFVRGKTVVTSPYGGTPNSITRYLMAEWGLDIEKDITLMEVDAAAIPSVLQQGQGDIAVVSDPILTEGIMEGIWQEPFYNVPQELGPYAYSTINVTLESIEEEPEVAQAFVDGMLKALEYVRDNYEGAVEIAKKEFPTMDEDVLKATIDRAYEDGHWEYSGQITEESVLTNLEVVKNAGMLEEEISYEQIVDMRFVQ